MLYGNINGYAYKTDKMKTLITKGRAKENEFFPIDKYYNVLESEKGGEWELSLLTFASKEEAQRYIKRMQNANAIDIAANLVPYWYTYEYKIEEVSILWDT